MESFLRRKIPEFLEALHVGELYRFWNTAWHHYAPAEPHSETCSIRTRPRLRINGKLFQPFGITTLLPG